MQLLKKLSSRALTGTLASALGLMLVLPAEPAEAQNLFAPVARVDGQVVTEYEVEQRLRFLRLLNAPNASRERVIEELIDDRLRKRAATEAGIEMTPEGLIAAQGDFAQRANLSRDEFIQALQQSGVDVESFRDFVEIQAVWRELIRARYQRFVDISEADIDRELSKQGQANGIRVLVSEIIIPAPPQRAAQVQALAEQIAASQSEAEFSSFAQRYSATPSRGAGGRLPWQDLERLPPSLQPLILGLTPGEVTAPLSIPNAVALFQLRGIEETGRPAPSYSAIDYARYLIAGGRSEAGLAQAARVRAQVDQCDDLYGLAKGQPAEVLTRETKAPGEIPQDIAIELSRLDANEISTTLTANNGQTLVLLMLCDRVASANAEVSREDVRAGIRQDTLQGYAARYLAQLRADARISRL
ncbi:MAG: peptidylprolyl isomerase [Sulfitobacter sp.]|nr:peptidylprolyl isomerase [Sulfitobacter sp.]